MGKIIFNGYFFIVMKEYFVIFHKFALVIVFFISLPLIILCMYYKAIELIKCLTLAKLSNRYHLIIF